MARKTIRLATKVKNPKRFEQKYKTIERKILAYTPHTAWVQTFGKQPKLLRNSGTAFVLNPLIYGPCRPSRLSDYVACKSARRTGPCLSFIDIKNPDAPQHPMFKEDSRTGLPIKLRKQDKAAQINNQNSPIKRKANKAKGKRAVGKPIRKLQTPRGMSLQTEIEEEKNTNKSPENDDDSSSSSEDISPSPKRLNQKQTPPTVATRKSTRNRQATLTTALGNQTSIKTFESAITTGKRNLKLIRHQIDQHKATQV